MRSLSLVSLTLALAAACFGQKWEIGGAAGYSFFQNQTINSPSGNAEAGFKNGPVFSVTGGENLYRYIGGEFRYTFISDDLKLKMNGQQATLGGQSHAFHYDFLFHGTPRESRIRPFAAVGAGARFFRGTGAESAFQPLMNIAVLTQTSEWKALISFGGGVKFAVSKHVLLRVDFRDYASPFPTKLIAPMKGASVSGWLHDLIPMGGISFTF